MKNINIIKYTMAHVLIAFLWAFIGGVFIALNNRTDNAIVDGAIVFFVGSIASVFVLGRMIKKGKIIWFLKKDNYSNE